MTLITARLTSRGDTEANWTSNNPILSAKEIAFSTDAFYGSTNQQKFKVGNGVSTWTALDYMPVGSGGVGGSQSLQDVVTVGNSVTGELAKSPDNASKFFLGGDGVGTNMEYVGSGGSGISEIKNTYNKLEHTTEVKLNAPSVTKNGVEVATISDIPSVTGLVPYTGATGDVDLGSNGLNAKTLNIKGTAGNGHLGLKHQSANITANASESSLGADSSGNPVWKNDGNAIQNILTNSNITQTVTNGVTDKAPSEDAVYDLFSSLDIANLIRQEFSYTSGAQTFTLTQTASASYAVFVNGQELNQSQYTVVGTTLTILDTLSSGNKVNIIYANVPISVSPSYTKLEVDALIAQNDANALLYAMSF